MPRYKKTNISRMNLELSLSQRQCLDRLCKRTDADSLADVIRSALRVYDLLTEQIQSGGEIVVRLPNGKEKQILIV